MESNVPPPPPPPPQVTGSNGQQAYPIYSMYTTAAHRSDQEAGLLHSTTATTITEYTASTSIDDQNHTNEFQRIVVSVASALERERIHQTELEAWTLFASSQLLHHNNSSDNSGGGAVATMVNTTNVPSSIADAWQAIADAAKKPFHDDVATESNRREKRTTNTAVSAVIPGLLDPTTLTGTGSNQELRIVTVPAGQQSTAVRKLILGNSLKRMATMANESIQQQHEHATGTMPQLKHACQKHHLHLNNDGGNLADPWLQLLDSRLHELQKYHAEHHHHYETELQLHTTTVGQSQLPSYQQHSNPMVNNEYDLAGTIREWTSTLDVVLSTEEVMGKYLDLHAQYDFFTQHLSNLQFDNSNNKSNLDTNNITNENNNPNGKRPISLLSSSSSSSYQYIDFLGDLTKGIGLVWSEEQKLLKRKKYARFVTELQLYVESFLHRTIPLIKIDTIITSVTDTFRASWARIGGSDGWQSKIAEAVLASTIGTNVEANSDNLEMKTATTEPKIDLSMYESIQDLAAKVDGDSLKAELSRLGLKCGGTIHDRAARLYLLKNTKLEDLPPKLFVVKPSKRSSMNDATTTKKAPSIGENTGTIQHAKNERRIDIAYREAIVTALLGQLGPTLEATIRRAERRQTQTLIEREREMDEELYGTGGVVVKEKREDGDDDDSEDLDTPIYNPKNVPLDFDGKPIPYWLFKLHGLNHYYPCEICGGESYRGRRHFELHFGEQKHTTGMRSLGIPNTKHFHGVTTIVDAQILWQSLQEKLQQNKFDERNDEEYEDSHGNVLSRTAYEDLARHNLL